MVNLTSESLKRKLKRICSLWKLPCDAVSANCSSELNIEESVMPDNKSAIVGELVSQLEIKEEILSDEDDNELNFDTKRNRYDETAINTKENIHKRNEYMEDETLTKEIVLDFQSELDIKEEIVEELIDTKNIDEPKIKEEIVAEEDENQLNIATKRRMYDEVPPTEDEPISDTKEIALNFQSELDIKEESVEEHDGDERQSNFTPKRKSCEKFPPSSGIESDTKGNLKKNNETMEDEYDVFLKDIAAQLRQLPARSFMMLKEKIQELITKEKFNYISSNSIEIRSRIKIEKE